MPVTVNDCVEALTHLCSHPFTLLSLSDRERFHTGFLVFVMNRYPQLMRSLFPNTCNLTELEALAEEDRVDLVVKTGARVVAAAEVKLKTDLRNDQLSRIDKLISDAQRGGKALIGLFPPARKRDRDFLVQGKYQQVSLTEIPCLLQPSVDIEGDNEIATLIQVWLKYLRLLHSVRQYFVDMDSGEIHPDVRRLLGKIKLRGIFEAYRYGLVSRGIEASELEIGNTRGNAQIHIPLAINGSKATYGLQWQSEILKLFISTPEEVPARRSARDHSLKALATSLYAYIEAQGWKQAFKSRHDELNRNGKFRSITIADWSCFAALDGKGETINTLLNFLRRNPPAIAA